MNSTKTKYQKKSKQSKALKPFYGITRINSKCINKCLERGGTFCNMPRTEYGVCCKNVKSCRKYDANFCSYDAPKTSKTL